MENSDWVMKDYPLTYIKTFQGVADVRVFHNIYWDEDDYGVPPNKHWAMSCRAAGIEYCQLDTTDLEEAKVMAVEAARKAAFNILAALMTENT